MSIEEQKARLAAGWEAVTKAKKDLAEKVSQLVDMHAALAQIAGGPEFLTQEEKEEEKEEDMKVERKQLTGNVRKRKYSDTGVGSGEEGGEREPEGAPKTKSKKELRNEKYKWSNRRHWGNEGDRGGRRGGRGGCRGGRRGPQRGNTYIFNSFSTLK